MQELARVLRSPEAAPASGSPADDVAEQDASEVQEALEHVGVGAAQNVVSNA